MRMIDATSPEEFEHVSKTRFDNYIKGEFVGNIFRSILGEGIFAVDGHKWLSIRKATSKIFSVRNRLSIMRPLSNPFDLQVSNFRGIVSQSIDADLIKLDEYLDQKSSSGEEFDLAAVFFAFTIASFGKMAFSVDIDVGVLSGEKQDPNKPLTLAQRFAEEFDFAQGGLSRRLAAPWWQIDFWSAEGRRMRLAAKTLDEFAYSIIDARAQQEGEDKEKDLLSLYKALRDANGQPLDRRTLRVSRPTFFY